MTPKIGKSERKRIEWLDIMKGFAILLVVYGHILQNEKAVDLIYMIHLPIFMFVSGLLYKQEKFKNNVIKKSKSILIPYFFFSICCLIYFYVVENKFRSVQLTPLQSVLGIMFGYYDYLGFNVHLWYLPFFFMTIVLYNAIGNITNIKIARCLFILLGIIYLFYQPNNMFFSLNRFDLMMFFGLGNCFSDIVLKKQYVEKKKSISFIFIFLICSGICVYLKNFYYIVACFGILISVILSKAIEKKEVLLKKMGEISLVILCVHGPIYRVLIKIFSIIANQNMGLIRTNFIYCSIIVLVTLIICDIIYLVIEKIFPILVGKNKIRIQNGNVVN